MKSRKLFALCAALFACFLLAPSALRAQSDTPGLLTRDQTSAILPATVFFRGQSASIQGRNSAGLRLPGGKLVLAALVDTSGYSTAVKESYQAYLLTEVPLSIAGKTLVPGAYGFGFVAGDRFVVLDIGGNTLFTVPSTRDAALPRPNPLQLLADPSGGFRLYAGRSFVPLAPAR